MQSKVPLQQMKSIFAMGIICATPTAGSSGTIPGALFKLEKTHDLTEEQMIDFLFTSALFGRVVANNASVAGATGGRQAEVGSASAMAANAKSSYIRRITRSIRARYGISDK